MFHLFSIPFRLGPKISGRDLLLVEECCNAPDPMRQVSVSYSPSLPCHLLACCTLPCHHMHFLSCHHMHCIAYVFVSCIRAFSPLSILQSGAPLSPGVHFYLFSCAGVKRFRIGPRLAKRPWFTTGRLLVKFRIIWTSFDTPSVNRGTKKASCVLHPNTPPS